MDGSQAKAFTNRGYYRIMSGQYEPAITDLTHVITQDSTDALAYNNRGLGHYYLHQYAEAEQDCLRSLQLKPDNAYAFLNLGKIYLASGKKEKACDHLQKASGMGNQEARALQDKECK
jgi:Flp pilus assembly protein TadD